MTETQISPVDLHVHAMTIDQALSVVRLASEKKVKHVAILQRAGFVFSGSEEKEIVEGGPELENVFFGTEYTCEVVGGRRADLIALGADPESEDMRSLQQRLVDWNAQALDLQAVKLSELGFEFNTDELSKLRNEVTSRSQPERAWGIAQLAVGNKVNLDLARTITGSEWELKRNDFVGKYSGDLLEAKLYWYFFLSPQSANYIPAGPPEISSKNFIAIVHKAGGIVAYSPERNFDKLVWEELQDQGVDGIYAWHGGAMGVGDGKSILSQEDILEARRKKLLVLGGGDYDPKKNDWQIGEGMGGMYISPRRVSELKEQLERVRS